jgi:hypothetical protein
MWTAMERDTADPPSANNRKFSDTDRPRLLSVVALYFFFPRARMSLSFIIFLTRSLPTVILLRRSSRHMRGQP